MIRTRVPTRAPVLAVALAVVLAFGAGACTIGPDEDGSGATEVTVTRDFGAKRLLRSSARSIPGGETVMRFLQRHADVETRYGGRFVNAIEGLRSGSDGGRRQDWFYYVNGVEADVGAAERKLEAGDRVWWDYHDWSGVMRVPAVVGSFPEPFIHGSEGKRFPVRIDCAQDARATCEGVSTLLDRAGVSPSTTALGAPAGEELLRLVVGEWRKVRRDAAARQIEQGPDVSGVFARITPKGGGYELELLDELGRVALGVGPGTGLVAATRFEEQQPTWVVTGTDQTGLERAARLLQRSLLRDRFAVATLRGPPISLPLPRRPQSATRR
jgi:hypothetical protein